MMPCEMGSWLDQVFLRQRDDILTLNETSPCPIYLRRHDDPG
jgi:hypothetical protein